MFWGVEAVYYGIVQVENRQGRESLYCKPSGPSGRSLSGFLEHEAARGISASPWMGC